MRFFLESNSERMSPVLSEKELYFQSLEETENVMGATSSGRGAMSPPEPPRDL